MQILKKLIAWILILTVQQFIYCCAADIHVVESYYVLKYEYEQFLNPLILGGATEEELLTFFGDVEEELKEVPGLSKQNVEVHLKNALLNVATYRHNRNLSGIIFMCYQEDIQEYSDTNKVPERLMGLYEAMIKVIFGEENSEKIELAKLYDIAKIEYNNRDAYTDESIEELKTAMDGALSVLKKKDAGADEIKSAIATLNNAYERLEMNPDYQGSSQGGSSGGGSSSPSIPAGTVIPDSNGLFTDLTDQHWSYQAVKYLTDLNILSGYDDGSFKPDNFIKREEVARILCAAMKLEYTSAEIIFTDVSDDAWYREYVNIIYNAGIMKGISEYEFGAGLTLTRQDLAVIADRLITDGFVNNSFTSNSDKAEFADINDAADYAKEAITHIKELGIIAGVGGNKFAPKDGVTRAQVAQIIYNLIRQY